MTDVFDEAVRSHITSLNRNYNIKDTNRDLYTIYPVRDEEYNKKNDEFMFRTGGNYTHDQAFWTCFLVHDKPYLMRRTDCMVLPRNSKGFTSFVLSNLIRVPVTNTDQNTSPLLLQEIERLKSELITKDNEIIALNIEIQSLKRKRDEMEADTTEEATGINNKEKKGEEEEEDEEEEEVNPPRSKRIRPIDGFTWFDIKAKESRFKCDTCQRCVYKRYTKTHKCKK